MAINGQIKFFEKSRSDKSKVDTQYSALSNEDFLPYLFDRSNQTFWISSGSDDTTTEYIEIEFDQAYDIDRLCLVKNNFKDFNVRYDLASAWTHFANVETLEGTQSNITETANTKETNYYQFDSVNTSKIRIEATKTQTADQEKKLYQFIVSEEIGTFEYWPGISMTSSKNKLISRVLSGKEIINDNIGFAQIQLEFTSYPSANDLNIGDDLIASADPFLIWLCGGDETQFSTEREGFRLEDFYLMKVRDEVRGEFTNNLYKSGYNFRLVMKEHV